MRGSLARSPLLLVLVGMVLVFVLAPLAVAIAIGFSASPFLVFPPPGFSTRWIARFLDDPAFVAALWVSLRLAAVVTALGVGVALVTAFGMTALSPRARGALTALILAPLLFPVILLALGLLLFFAEIGILRSPLALVLAHLLIVVPLCVVTIKAAIEGLNPEMADAAASLGAPPARAFALVVMPQIGSAIAGAAVLSFLFSFNDVVFAAFLGGPASETLPLKLFGYVRYRLDPLVGAVSAIFIFTTLALIVILDRIVGFDRIVGIRRRE